MSKVEYGSSTITSTGNKTIILNDDTINIEKVVLFISNSSTEVSAGYGDEVTNFTGSATYADEDTTYSISHYRNIGGTKTLTFQGTITATSFNTVGEFVLNVSTCTQSTQVKFVAYGT